MKTWMTCSAGMLGLTLHVQPGARRTELAGEHGDALKIRLAAPPVDGKANAALIAWLAERLDVPRRDIVIRSGETARRKILQVSGTFDESEILARLGFQ